MFDTFIGTPLAISPQGFESRWMSAELMLCYVKTTIDYLTTSFVGGIL